VPDSENDRILRLAEAHERLGNFDRARKMYQEILAADPENGPASQALIRLSAFQSNAEEHFESGRALQAQGRHADAVAEFRTAIKRDPRFADAHLGLAIALQFQGLLDEAIAAYRKAITVKPNFVEAHFNLGLVLQEAGDPLAAIAAFREALALDPDLAQADARLLHQQLRICDWSNTSQMPDLCARLGITTDAVSPFSMLSAEDNPERQMLRATKYAGERYRREPLLPPPRPKSRRKRLRVGYFSSDFHDHAVLFLMAGMMRAHDRRRFDVFAYSYGQDKSGELRKRLEGDVEHFIDVAALNDAELVQLARGHDLDIAIDLKGYTQRTRSGAFAYRLAPVQINYLGYPGTMGADFIDYIVADPVIIPDGQRAYISEKVIYLPHTYQPTDDRRRIAKTKTSRADFSLPQDGFVFCCFNNNYKIGPREFDIWMRLLGEVEGSVLWLLRSNEHTEQNLRNEATKRGIDPGRLVFADKLPQAEHLARHKHADIFIDTFAYNAHTTASDALWAGLPVVTKVGEQFAARVAASLLRAVDLPELVTETDEAYEAMILDLATHPEKLAAIKAQLEKNHRSAPLFDTRRYTRNFERGLDLAYDLYLEGKPPEDIHVKEA